MRFAVASRWEKPVMEQVLLHLDDQAVGGRFIRTSKLDVRVFDGRPQSHAEPAASDILQIYECLRLAACSAGRLDEGVPLVKNWRLTGDIFSPKLNRFIEVDERQHFSAARLARLTESRSALWAPLYADHFWNDVFPRLSAKPFCDLDPPHRDEARAYRDELRERLPVLYGLRRTIRLDEFTLHEFGVTHVKELIEEILESDTTNGDRGRCSD